MEVVMEYDELSELQSKYLETRTNSVDIESLNRYKCSLKSLHLYETDKNIFEVGKDEFREIIIECIKGLEIKSIFDRIYHIKAYLEWIVANGYSKIKFNFTEMLKSIRENLDNIYELDVLSRDEVYKVIKGLEDKQFSMTFALLFEGVKGVDKDVEILTAKISDLVDTSLRIRDSSLVIPHELVELVREGQQRLESNGKCNYVLNDYLIHNAGKHDMLDRSNYIAVSNRFTRANSAGMFSKKVGTLILTYSGIMFYLSVVEQINSELTDDDYYKVATRYKLDLTEEEMCRIKGKYLLYKKSDEYDPNIDVHKYSDIYKNIMNIDLAEHSSDKINQELGKFGEEYFLSLLNAKYLEENVVDQTQLKAGYDFLVKTTDCKYEVKSTGIISDTFKFHLTIGEIRKAILEKEKYLLTVLSFRHKKLQRMFIVPDFIKEFRLEKQMEVLLDLDKEGKCIPEQVAVKVEYELLKKYVKNI